MRYQFVDCRFVLGEAGAGRSLYLDSHIPGASFMDLDDDLADHAVQGGGRHPLPSAERFARAAARAGIGSGVFVVAYDEGMSGGAARLWWLLRHFGHEDVAVLDGGLRAWRGPLRSGEEPIERADFVTHERQGDTIAVDELASRLGEPGLVLVDARAPERFRGEVELRDPKAGHIPGARNLPYSEPGLPEDILDATEIVAYCGSGVTACVNLLKLHEAGRDDARLYVGSWSDWSTRDLPIEVGPSSHLRTSSLGSEP